MRLSKISQASDVKNDSSSTVTPHTLKETSDES